MVRQLGRWVLVLGATGCLVLPGSDPDGDGDGGGGGIDWGGGGGGGGGGDVDYEIPSDFPQIGSRDGSQGTWRLDPSSYEDLPHPGADSVEDLAQSEGAQGYGALYIEGEQNYSISFVDEWNNWVKLHVESLESGVYETDGFYQKITHYDAPIELTTDVMGGDGVIEVVGHSDSAVWGTFSARLCDRDDPSACHTLYDGRFSALTIEPWVR